MYAVGIPCFVAFWAWELRKATRPGEPDGGGGEDDGDGGGGGEARGTEFVGVLKEEFIDGGFPEEIPRNRAVVGAAVVTHVGGLVLAATVGACLH